MPENFLPKKASHEKDISHTILANNCLPFFLFGLTHFLSIALCHYGTISCNGPPSSTMTATTTPPLHDVLAGGVAGSAGIIIGHPLDSMKVRLQTAASSSSFSSSSMMTMLARQGGRHKQQQSLHLQQPNQLVGKHKISLWAGIGPPLVMASLVNASVFVTYGTTTRLWDEYSDSGSSQSTPTSTSTTYTLSKNAVCGGIAGIASSIIVCPVDLVKTKLQTSSCCRSTSTTSFSSYQTTKEIYTNYGIRGFYRGLLATVYRQFPSFVIYFGSYDIIKSTLLQQQQQQLFQQQTLLASIIAGGIAGSLSWAIIYPLDLIKTRIQSLSPTTTTTLLTGCSSGRAAAAATQRSSYYHLIKTEQIMIHSITTGIINQHGWKALYSGFGITVLRAFPVNAVIFPTYELALATLQHIL